MSNSTVLKCGFPLCPGIQRKKRVFAGDEQLRDHPAGKENGLESRATSLCFQGLSDSLNQEDLSAFFSFFFHSPSVLQIQIFADPILTSGRKL